MFDVFYSVTAPGLFAHERKADSIEHARSMSRTRFFWWITYLCDYSGFDFLWLPSPWQAHQRHAWPSQWQADSGTYLVPTVGYADTNYHSDLVIPRLPDTSAWRVPEYIDTQSFDFSWHPDFREPDYEYHFGTQWQSAGGPIYQGSGVIKLINEPRACALTNRKNWSIPDHVDADSVDYSWHPNPLDPPYIYHFPDQHQPVSGVAYTTPGGSEIKLVDAFVTKTLPNTKHWSIPDHVDADSIDYTWHPNPLDPPYIYHFATKQHWDRIGGPEYCVPGATSTKYLDDIVANTKSNPDWWHIPAWIDPNSIDRTWVPNPAEEPYIYEFPVEWGWNNIGGPEYRVPGATCRKYSTEFVSRTQPDPTHFVISDNIADNDDILRWRPNPTETPYVYVFGNQWYPAETRESARYTVPGATELKYINELRTVRLPSQQNYNTLIDCDFDYSWEPDPGSPPYIYVFGNQHWPAEIMPTVEYQVPGAVERKFMSEPRAQLLTTEEHWQVTTDHAFEFDRSWCPDPGDPPYIYVFGNQWHPAVVMSTIEYHVPGATERKFLDHPQARILPDQSCWSVPEEVVADRVDFSWIPDPGSPPYIYHFGTDFQASVNLTYTVPGGTEIKFAGDIPTRVKEQTAVAVLDIFYLDRSNAVSASRFARLQERYPHIQRVRYVNSVMDTIKRCLNKTRNTRFWVIGSENVYDDFDFAWHPEPWQRSMTHVFGSQWNKWSDTFLVNRWEFERNARWASGIEEFPNLNFVQDQQVTAPADAAPVYVLDHGNADWQYLQDRCRVVRSARYFDNYLDSLRRLLTGVEEEHIWVVSSVCDYTRFDFSWQPEAWQRDMLHVFPSNEQKFGDTFYVPVRALRDKIDSLELLDWFETVNYCDDQRVKRLPMPVVQHDLDSHVDIVLTSNLVDPLVLYTNRAISQNSLPTVSLWRERVKTVVPLDAGAGAVIVPKNAIPYIKTQLYDYPHIDRTQRHMYTDTPLDIVFIDNGEPNADENWKVLEWAYKHPRTNRLHRSSGVKGRVAAYKAAAELSTTPWFFAVFAKLHIDNNFDWSWQPDRMQQPKHYIFHARNPVNGLVYGHQAMIAYNRQLVLANDGTGGLDFTLDDAHEVVPVLSGTAYYNTSPWVAWRTAFREVLKLRHSLPDVENEYRLNQWLNFDNTDSHVVNESWSRWGAEDAVEYYESVAGDFAALKKSYEWSWLASYALIKRNLAPD
jgi:hypothetical protein